VSAIYGNSRDDESVEFVFAVYMVGDLLSFSPSSSPIYNFLSQPWVSLQNSQQHKVPLRATWPASVPPRNSNTELPLNSNNPTVSRGNNSLLPPRRRPTTLPPEDTVNNSNPLSEVLTPVPLPRVRRPAMLPRLELPPVRWDSPLGKGNLHRPPDHLLANMVSLNSRVSTDSRSSSKDSMGNLNSNSMVSLRSSSSSDSRKLLNKGLLAVLTPVTLDS
jgi:hypothetical protein